MNIEALIAALIAALTANTEALNKAAGAAPAATTEKPKAVKGKTETAAKDEPKVTQDMVNAALVKIKDDFGMEHARPIITEFGKCARMSEIKPAQYQAVFDAAVAKHAELSEPDADDGL